MLIDYRDGRPIYEQIAENYKRLILMGVMEPDEQLPSVRALAMELSTNPNTVQRAYTELEREGYLYSVKGKGNFVLGDSGKKEQKRRELKEELLRLLKEAEELGMNREQLLLELRQSTEGEQND